MRSARHLPRTVCPRSPLRRWCHSKIRNFAIVAHVDHGKTTLVDCLLKYARGEPIGNQQGERERVMDHIDLEKERGITIRSKWTQLTWKGTTMNIVDTPGHSDFSGEVERVLSLVDGICLIVDAAEGPMAQTRFVLSKALAHNLHPVVIVNKVDKPDANVVSTDNRIFDMFLNLDANDEQMEYPTIYSSAKQGWSALDLNEKQEGSMSPIFETIMERVPPPKTEEGPFALLVTDLEPSVQFGTMTTGKIQSGSIKVGDALKAVNPEGKEVDRAKVLKLFSRDGLEKVAVNSASAGDIIQIAGLKTTQVRDTIQAVDSDNIVIQSPPVEPPIMSVFLRPNDGPLSGRGTRPVIQFRQRLDKENLQNVTLEIIHQGQDSYEVKAKGDMQIGILLETLRREGFEMLLSSPTVLTYKDEKTKQKMEPIEDVWVDVPDEHYSEVMSMFVDRRAKLLEQIEHNDRTRMHFHILSRAMLGMRGSVMRATKGESVMDTAFLEYVPFDTSYEVPAPPLAVVSTTPGKATAYGVESVQDRAEMFIEPGEEVYEGQIVGEVFAGAGLKNDLEFNVTKEKSGMSQGSSRPSGGGGSTVKGARKFQLEDAISYLSGDDLLEVTPTGNRIRKKYLTKEERVQAKKRAKK
eukprot:TRINITY_DN18141_c0_g1_i1.p1 TRINITY_DN18141_c0_g1~~TRINITY_DN18141_c0_g1_i1.p1  ORF type:complete len:635 (-),score=64.67 TRINITY_DN18141_c0_g1_i1:139-2043(-)